MPARNVIEMNSSSTTRSSLKVSEPDNVNHPTILLVDDDDQIRKLCRDYLVAKGFRVLEGDSGLEALLVAANFDGAISVLITDLEMPRIGGIELAQVFKTISPTTSVLYISGAPCESIRADLGSNFAFLPKPFLPGQLLKVVVEVLDARAQHATSFAAVS